MQITVTRGLTELKTLDARIQKAISSSHTLAIVSGEAVVTGFKSNEDFAKNVLAARDSVQALIKRRNEIKTAVIASNAETMVKIGEKKMSRAEAIERKDSIKYEMTYLNKLQADQRAYEADYNRRVEFVKDKADELVRNAYSSKDKKVTGEEYESITKPYLNQNLPKLIDPLEIKKVIEALEKEIDEFNSEVDFVLSESNATTFIEVSDN